MSATPELDDRVTRAAAALGRTDYRVVMQRCIADLELSTGISRECRRKLRSAIDRLVAAFKNVTGRVVNLVRLIKTAMHDTLGGEVRLQFEFCGMIERAATV